MSRCDCYKKVNEALAAYNTRIEMVFSLGGNTVGMPWPIATKQIEKGRGKQKAIGLHASFCPMCGVSLQKESAND